MKVDRLPLRRYLLEILDTVLQSLVISNLPDQRIPTGKESEITGVSGELYRRLRIHLQEHVDVVPTRRVYEVIQERWDNETDHWLE